MKYLFSEFNKSHTYPGFVSLLVLKTLLLLNLNVYGANVITVFNLDDDGIGSLRNAINTAGVNDTIRFSDGLTGTILLSSGQLEISQSLIIDGPGSDAITVSGDGLSRVIFIASGVNVEIYNLTIADGYTTGYGGTGNGAGILNEGNTTIGNCEILNNEIDDGGAGGAGSGIFNENELILQACIISNNFIFGETGNKYGAGIMHEGSSLFTVNTDISGNYFLGMGSSYGGGIYAQHTTSTNLQVTLSAIYNNDADIGGAAYIGNNVTASFKNTTVSTNWGNSNTGGIFCEGSLELLHTTIANNTNTGLTSASVSSFIKIYNSIFDNNNGDINFIQGSIISSHSSISDGSYGLSGTNDQTEVTNLNLGALQDNGGLTVTHALNTGSAAIDNADNGLTTTSDQRFYERIANGIADRGAFEFGTLAFEPTNQIDELTFDFIYTTSTGFYLDILDDIPDGALVLRRPFGSTPTPPIDGESYAIGDEYAGQTVVASANEEYIEDVDGLTPNTKYEYDIYTFNGEEDAINYNTTDPYSIDFQTLSPPIIDSFNPSLVQAGENITISGNHFNEDPFNNLVRVGGLEATVNSGTVTELNVTIPFGANSNSEISVLDFDTWAMGSSINSPTPKLKVNFDNGELITNHTYNQDNVLAAGASLSTITNADLNADGLLDILFSIDGFIGIAYRRTDNTGFLPANYISSTLNFDQFITSDLDNDGLIDFVGIDILSNTISIFYRTNDNLGFDEPEEITALSSPTHLQIGDLNQDGYHDLVVAGSGQFAILYRNIINEDYEEPIFYGPGTGTSHLALSDFNNDGKVDIAVTLENPTDNIKIYLQDADNTFSLSDTYSAGDSPTEIIATDLNNDGIEDLVTLNVFQNSFTILESDNNGDFTVIGDVVTPDFPYAIHDSDFNGDGNIDIAVLSINNEEISIFTGNGVFGFDSEIIHAAGSAPEWLTVGDFNHDGKPDLAINNTGDEEISIHYYKEPPLNIVSISPHQNSVNIEQEQTIELEFNRNINPATVDQNSIFIRGSLSGIKVSTDYNVVDNTISIDPFSSGIDFIHGEKVSLTITDFIQSATGEPLNNGRGTFFSVKTGLAPAEFIEFSNLSGGGTNNGFASGDFNNDFIPDLAILKNSEVEVYVGNGDGTFSYNTFVNLNTGSNDVIISDFNNDGLDDIAISNNSSNYIKIFFNGAGDYQIPLSTNVPIEIKSADFNNDGWMDIAVAFENTNKLRIYLGVGDDTFTQWDEITSGSTFINQFDIADFNNDGHFDIALSNGDTDNIEIFVQDNNGFISTQLIPNEAGVTNFSELSLTDLNNDYLPDLVYTDFNDKSLSIHLNNGDNTFASRTTSNLTNLPTSFTTNDLNGDGFQDIAVTIGAENKIDVFLGKGDGTLQLPKDFSVGSNPIKIITAPIDEDSDIDILVLNGDGDQTLMLLNEATPEIILNNINVPASNLSTGSTEQIIYKFTGNVAKGNTTLEQLIISTTGNYLSTDIGLGGFKLFHNTVDNFTTATELSNDNLSTGNGENINFNGINEELNIGSINYFWVTVDISPTATANNTIGFNNVWFADISFSEGIKTGTNPMAASNTFTITPPIKPEPSNHVNTFTAVQSGSDDINVSWLNALGIQEPDNYLLLGRRSGSAFPIISDFTFIPDDTDWTDGTVAVNINHTIAGSPELYSFSNLIETETYHFVVYPYTNLGIDVNYKTDNPPTTSISIFNPPTLQASNITSTNRESNSITINWTNGGGTSRIIIASEGNDVEGEPVDFTTYTANSVFGDGDDIDTNDYVVYKGAGNNVNVTGLSPSTQYTFKVFEFNGTTGLEKYFLTNSTGNPNSEYTLATEPTQQAENLSFSNIDPTSVSLTYDNPSSVPDGYIIIRGNGSNTTLEDGVNYSVGQTINGNEVIYKGNGISFSDANLTPGASYTYEVFSFNGIGSSTNYLQLNPLTSTVTLPASLPTLQASRILFTSLNATSLKLNWVNGNGTQRIVLVKENSAIDAVPIIQNTYVANSIFGQGSELGSGNFVVYNGTENNVTISGLTAETQYFVQVFEFNGSAGTENYLTNSALQNPLSRFTIPTLVDQKVISNASPSSSTSSGMIIFSGTSNDDFLQNPLDEITWGHNGLSATETNTWIEGTVAARWERSWYIAKSDQQPNTNGDIKIVFDLSDASSASSFEKNKNYFLIYSPDNASNYSIVNYGDAYKIPSSDKIEFRLNAVNLPEGYYTLGTTDGNPFAENAVLFDGVDDNIQLGNKLLVPNSFTIEAWINVDDVSLKNPVISKGINDSNESFLLMVNQGKLVFDWGGNTAKLNSNRDLESGKWYHIAAVYNKANNTASIYLNGLKVGEKTSAPPHTDLVTTTIIGKNSSDFFKGKIDELRIWNSPKNQSDIRLDNYQHINGNEPNLLAYYRFDKYDGNILPDLSSNDFSGILVGSMTTSNWVTSGAMVAPVVSFNANKNSDSIAQGKKRHVFYGVELTPSLSDVFLEGIRLQMDGSYNTSDLDSISLYISLDQTLDTTSDNLLQRVATPETGNYLQFNNLSDIPLLNKDITHYLLISTTVKKSAVIGNTFNINAPAPIDIYTSAGSVLAGTVTQGGNQTIISPFVVTNTNNNGKGSLRWATENANKENGKTITFNLSGTGPWSINLSSELPPITSNTVIDGSTQSNWSNTNRIFLNGQNNLINGIKINSPNCEIYGLSFLAFTNGILVDGDGQDGFIIGDTNKGNIILNCGTGILIKGADNGFVSSNRIGVNATGTLGNINSLYGIHIQNDASGITIGGTESGKGNLISGNAESNVYIENASNNFLKGNIIGSNFQLNDKLGGKKGIWLDALSTNNTIGGSSVEDINVIGGHSEYGIFIEGNSNIVSKNIIGSDNSFSNDLGNGIAGVFISGNNNLAGGNTLAQGNFILNNPSAIVVDGIAAIYNKLRFNRVYCNSAGVQLLNNSNNQIASATINYANKTTIQGTTSPSYTIDIYTDSLDNCTPKQGKFYLGSAIADASGNFTFTGNFTEGHQITAQVTDANDNTSDFSIPVVVDTTPPSIPVINSISDDSNISNDFITNDNTLFISGTGEINSTIYLSIDNTEAATTTVDASGNWSIDLSANPFTNGTYLISTKAVDNSFNESSNSSPISLVIDSDAPNAPNILSISDDTGIPNDGITADNTLFINGTSEENAKVYLYIDGTQQGNTTADTNGDFIFDLTTIPFEGGSYNLTAKVEDIAGNLSNESSSFSLVIDTTAPNIPVVTSISEDSNISNDFITNDSTLIINGTGEINSTINLYIDNNQVGTTVANASGNWSIDITSNPFTNGTFSLSAKSVDNVGNESSLSTPISLEIDINAPVAPSINLISDDTGTPNDGITSDNTLIISGSTEADAKVYLYIDGAVQGNTNANNIGEFTFDITNSPFSDGSYNLTTRAEDVAGNLSNESVAFILIIDNTAPTIPTISSISDDTGTLGDGLTADNTLLINGISDAENKVYLYIDGTLQGNTTANTNGEFSIDITNTPFANGTFSLTTRAEDIAGNISNESTPFTLTVDSSTPNTPIISSLSEDSDIVGDRITKDNTLLFSGTADPNLTIELFLNGNSIGDTTVQADGNWIFDYTSNPLVEGNYQLTAIVKNLAGTPSTTSDIFNFTYIEPPINQASNVNLANYSSSSAILNWQKGNGNGEVVVIFPSDQAISLPEENTRYVANTNIDLASTLGNGKVVFSNNANSVEITGLTPATKYKAVVFTYNDITEYITYNSDTAENVLFFETLSTEPTNPPNGLIFTEIQEDTITFSFLPSIQESDGYFVVRRELGAITPTDGVSYQIGEILSNQLVSSIGSEVSFTQIGLQPLTTYFYDIYAYNGSANSINYLQSSPLTHEVTTPDVQPTSQAQNLQLTALNSSTIRGEFEPAPSGADGYLILYTNQTNNNLIITDGSIYFDDETFDGWTVLQQSNATSFIVENLSINTNYTFTVIAYNGNNNTVNYRFNDRLVGNLLTGNSAPSSISLTNVSFTESTSIGSLVGTLSSADIDNNDTHTYSLVNNSTTTDSTAFRINGDRLEVNKNIFFADNRSFQVSIQSTDNNGGSLIQDFTIFVNEIPLLPSDSTAVLSLYQGLSSAPIFNSNNLVRTWEGTSVRGGRVTGINLSSLELDSISVESILSLDALDTLLLNDNSLSFQYLEPFAENISNYSYLPQASPEGIDTLIAFSNNPFTISIRENTSNELYQWFKSGDVIEGATSSSVTFNIPDKNDEGLYQCEIKSSIITDLTLYSKTYYLKVINVLNTQDSLSLVSVMQNLYNGEIDFNLSEPAANWPGVTESNNRVVEINLSNAGLSGNLSKEIGNLTELTRIDLFNNNLKGTLPAEIGNLTNLTYLDIDQNNFEGSIPEEIGNLVNLTTLWLARNNFTSIPSSIGNLENLEFLFLQENLLTTLPEQLGLLANLKTLDVSSNSLVSFIEEVSGMQRLEELDISNNKITRISADLENLTNLRLLDLSNNRLSEIPFDLEKLTNLERFYIYNNLLTFEDIEPLDLTGTSYQLHYAPQKQISNSEDIFALTDNSLALDFNIGGTDNSYVWEKDGVIMDTTSSGTINFSNLDLDDAGTYTTKVYSNVVPDLEIQNKQINVFITCSNSPLVTINTEFDTTVCEGKNIYVELISDKVEGREYSWRKDGQKLLLANSEKYIAFETGNYNLIVTDTSGCAAISNSINIESVPTPKVTISMLDSTMMLASTNTTGNKVYRWYLNGELIENETDSTLQVGDSGLYKASVENEFSCEGFSTEVSFVVTNLENNTLSKEINLYPNPARSSITIELPKLLQTTHLEIYNATGLRVKEFNMDTKTSSNHILDISDISRGVYTIIIKTKNGKAVKRFIKM